MDTLDQLQAKLDKILNPSMPEPVAIPEVKAQAINPMYYQIAAGMGNNDGAASMSPVEKDLRTLTPNQLYAKYGQQQADEMLGQLALASGELQRGNLAERDWGETVWDSTTGVANAFVGGLGGIAAWGAGKVNADAGVALSDAVGDLRKFTEENQSDTLNARRKIGAAKDALTQRDSDAQYNADVRNGDSKTVAGLAQFGRDFVNSSVFDDSTLLGQGTADAIGSLLTAGPVAGVLRKGLTTLIPKSATKVNSVADKLVWPAAIGTLESGGTYQQTVEDATNTLKQQGKTVGDKLELINDTAQQAADRMFLPAAALGTITRFGEKPFHVPNVKTAATNILGRELPEEAGQGALGTILSNQAIQDKIDPNRKIGEGVAEATVQGAVYGLLAAGAVQGPGIAKQSVVSAAKATLGYVDKRTSLAAEKADDASPVGTKALKEKASTLVPNAEPVKQTLAAELAGTELPDEEKNQGIKYANDLIDSLRVSVENEFDDTIPPELSAIISGSEHRIDAIQQLAKKVITTSDPNEKFFTAATLYQLLQPILDLQTNRPSSVDSLSTESQAVLKDYESLIANVNNSPTIKNAMKQIHDIMVAQGAAVISPITEKDFVNSSGNNTDQKLLDRKKELELELINLELDYQQQLANAKEDDLVLTPFTTPIEEELVKINSQLQGDSSTLSVEGKQKVNAIITAANIAPDQGNLDATESIMKHAKEGKLTLTPEQTTTLNASVALLRARKELEEKNKQFGLNATDIVSSEILTDRGVKDSNARSATQYTQEILSAVRRGNTLGAAQLLNDMGLFVKHMKNKVEAINKHYLNGNPKAAPVPYEALLPTTHQWVDSATNPKAIHKGGFVNTLNPGSIKFVQGVELEHKILADVYNSLTEVFPDLGIDRIEPLQLEKGISGAVRRTTQEATKPVVKEEPKPEIKVVEPKAEDKPIANKREVRLWLQNRKQELVDLADVNKQSVLESEYADEWQALEALTSPILSDENILDRSDLIVKLASQRNDPAITQFANEILKEAHARVTKDQEKKAATGQHTSFRKVDDPKRAAHQGKLDESRIFAEEAMKKGLQSIDKLEELLQGKKPVSPVELESTKVKPSIGEITHNPKADSEINKGIKNYSPIKIRFRKEYGTVYGKPVSIPGYENIKFSIYKDSNGHYKIVETSTGMLMPSLTGLRKIQDIINSVKSELDKHSLSKIESLLGKEPTLNKGFDYVFTKQSEPIKQESILVEPVVAKEVPVKQEEPVIDTTLDNELLTENTTVENNSPIVTGNKNAVIKVKPDTVVPTKFSNLVQGVKNFFINSFKFKGKETTRIDDVESPLQFVKDALLDNSLFQEAVPNSKYSLNKDVIRAYRVYLNENYDELTNKLTDNLKLFFSEKKRLARFEKGDPLNRFEEGKVLNITERTDKGYEYNQHLLELAALAGLQWFLTAGQTERSIEREDVAKLLDITQDEVTDELMNNFLNTSDMVQLSQSLTSLIKSFWGVSGINNEMMAYTDGIPEAMAAEIIRVFTELEMITLTKVDHPTKPKQEVNRFEVNRFDNDALYSFPTAIQEVVLVESEDVTYFGDDIPPVPQTQLGDPTIKLSRKEKKAIAAANKTEVKTNVLQANVIMSLSEDDLKVMFGGGIENEHMNKNTLASVQGKNKTILNAYQAMVDMLSRVDNVSKTLGKDASEVVMRFPHTITKVGRLMMLGKYNIQSSKLLREVFLPTWSTLDLQNNQDHIDAFHLAVSQALGIKVHNEGPESFNKLRVLLSGKLSPAITLVQEWMEATDNGENPIEFDGLKLAQIFRDAQEGLTPNAFHALIEYVRYQRTENKTKFTTGLYLEADGVTNGPGNAIQMLTLGRFTGNWVTTVEKIGHSFAEPKAKHELDKNNKDLYGTAGINTIKPLQNILSNMNKSKDKEQIMNVLGSLYSLLSMNVKGISYNHDPLMENIDLDVDRNAFKNPLTILLYGSGITGIAGKATKQMIDSIYKLYSDANVLLNSPAGKGLTEAQAMFPKSTNPQETYDKFQADLAAITSTTISYDYKEKQFTLDNVSNKVRSKEEKSLNNFTFFGSEINAITQNITKGLVDAMYQGAVETVGGTVMQSTRMIQQATQIQSILLEAAFTKAIQDKIASHKLNDPSYRAGDFISKQDFMDIMGELKVIAPYLKTPDQTFLAAKTKRYRNENDSKIEYSRSLNDKFRTEPNVFIPTNAGVSGTPNLVIGMGDAYAILQAAIDESLVGNLWIYDGINMPLDKITDYAPKLNKAAFEAWQNNPLRVIEESFRSFMGEKSIMIKALNETLNNEDLANQLNKSLRLYKTEDKLSSGKSDYALSIFGDLLNDLKNSADSIDARHAAIARMPNSVDQLAAAGVPYHNGITVDPTLDTPEKIAEQLNKYYQEELDKIKNKPKAQPVKQMTPAEMDPITKDMLSNAYHHNSGVKILNSKGLANLGRSINLSREQKIGFLQIIRAKTLDGYAVIFGSVDQIKEYRKQTNYSDISLDQETDNGFIDLKTKTIYLINPSVETLVHEMIHAATYGSVLNYYQDSSLNTKEVNEAIERTEGLMGEFLKLSPKELARLTPEARAAINNVKAAMQEPGNNLDNTSDVALAKSLNEFMAWSLSNQELISTFRKVEMPAYLRIAKEVIDIIKKFFTFKDKATGETKEQDLKVPKDLFGNLLFNASIIINSAQPSLAETMADTTLFHSGTAKHITQLRETLIDKVALFLDKSGQAFNVALYNSGFARVLTEAADTVNSLVPIFGLSSTEQSTLHHVVAALSAEIQVDPLTIDGIQTLYAHTVVELAKQVDAGTYPKAKYDALIGRIGNPKIINGKSTLLPVFLGLGLIDTELRDALAKIDMPTKTKNTTGTLNGGLENQANKMLDGLFKVLTGQRKAHDVSDALELLTERLTEIALKEDSAAKSVFNKPGTNIDKATEWVTDNIAVAADKGIALGKKLETSQYLAVKRLGSAITILSMMATDKNGETVARGAITIANKGNVWKPFRSLLTDFVGRSDSNAETYDLIKKVRAAVQQMRQTFRVKVPKIIAQKFTRPLDKKEWATLFRSMAKTDLSSLMDILSKKEIMEIFSNPSSLNKHISMLETRIQNQDKTNWSLYQAKMKQLAKFMNTGVTGSNLLRNPYAIHSLLNETKPKGFQIMGRDAIHDIDQLTTLYAIQSLSQEDKAIMSDMVNEQSEGLEFIIDYLVGQNVTEITKLSTNPTVQLNYYKGHIPQINQSGASLIVAEDVNRADLLLQGYTRVGDYFGSNLDANRLDKGYYFTDVSAKGAVAQGTIQNIQRTILGVDDFYGFTVGSNDRITDPIVVANITKRISRENVGIENLMPVFDAKGAVIAYERSMQPEKLALLKPSEHLAEMIGVWRGRQLEEQLAQEINEEVIDKHYDMYLKDIANSPSSQKEYVDVLDKKQLDVVEQDMVSLFSIDTIRYMANKNNGKFYVRKDVLDDMIGYRKASVSDIFTGKTRMNKPLQDAIRKVLISTFGVSAYRKAVKTERFLQNVVGEARTLIVVKSLVVPMFNIVSNIVQLVARGVPIATIVKSSPTKLLELRSYTMSQVKQVELEAEHRAASGDLRRQQVLESQIQAIKDGHKRLSIWPLIEAGEFSTISDIGNNSEDIDLFSGNTESWLDKQVSKLPANAQTVAKYGMVARDTALFQGLQKMVQYGDFIAKAVMYDDLMKRKGLTKEQALGKITDEFVNYDKLPGRARGYLEDTGLLWFYNYKLRITKIALSMMRNNPLHLLLAHAVAIPLGAGIATEDNFITKLLDGSLTRSIGPGMVVGAPLLNPWYNAMN